MRCLTSLAVVLSLCAALAAQPTTSRPGTAGDLVRDARRWVRLLELPERSTQAWLELMRSGAPASAPLCEALADPRPDVAVRAAWILGLLGARADAALPELAQAAAAAGADATVVAACRWAAARITFRGTIVADYQQTSVEVLGSAGAKRRSFGGMSGTWRAEPLAGEHLLVSEFTANRVRELDASGKQVWAFTSVNQPYGAMRLPNGNTLIADAGGGRVVEVDPTGKVAWEKAGLKRPVDAVRHPDGRTLVTDQTEGSVIELDAKGEIVWKIEGLERPQSAERLANGNTLIAVFLGNRVIEVDRKGATVFEIEIAQAQNAHRLENGHTLVAATTCYAEFDAKGKELWRRPGQYVTDVFSR